MFKFKQQKTPRIFFATDIHGSETCFRKFVNAAAAYSADALIMGGDVTGKQLALVVHEHGRWRIGDARSGEWLDSREAVDAECKRLSAAGLYPIVISTEEEQTLLTDAAALEERFAQERLDRFQAWMELAAERLAPRGIPCFVIPGNDDDRAIGEIVDRAEWVTNAEGKVVDVSGHEMISWGWSNPTPWDTPREQSEEELAASLSAMVERLERPESAIFNLHCPPYQSGLDGAPALDENLKPITRGGHIEMLPVGSTAVRDAIERTQPLLTLHGHIHDCRAMKQIGRTMCINPGSDYQTATLRGAIVQVAPSAVAAWTLTTG
jgi:Icc-related predicted phosphoesterase